MFKKSLEEKFHRIFGFKKTTFDDYSDEFEQDVLFIQIDKATSRVTGTMATCRVEGTIVTFGQYKKLPFGFFNKKIEKAKPEDVKDLFFYDVDFDIATSSAKMVNLHERRTRFVYLYKEQFDPNKGQLNQLNMECC